MSDEITSKNPVDAFIDLGIVPMKYLDKTIVEQMREYCEQNSETSVTLSIPLLERGDGGILDLLDENDGVMPDFKYE